MNLGHLISILEKLPSSNKLVFRYEGFKDYFHSDDLSNDEDQLPQDIYCYPKKVVYYDHDIDNIPEFFHSYRGYYSDISLSISPTNHDYTVGDILIAARKSIDFSFEGYKGGYYKMNSESRVWVSLYGNDSGLKCKGITQHNDTVYLDVIFDPFLEMEN